MLNAKKAQTPFSPTHNLTLFDDTSLTDPIEYRQVVGSLQYTLLTRLNIAFAVNKLCQFMHRPTIVHWIAIKLLLRYLCDTLYHCLF